MWKWALFDWKKILEIHNTLRNTVSLMLNKLKQEFDSTIPNDIKRLFGTLKSDVDNALRSPQSNASLASYKQHQSRTASTCISHAKSSKSHYMVHKVKTHGTASRSTVVNPLGTSTSVSNSYLDQAAPSLKDDFSQMMADIQQILDQPGGLTNLSLQEILNLVDDVIRIILDLVEDLGLAFVYMGSVLVDSVIELLNKQLDIPFVSALYHLITGNDLTILDVFCLIAAIPVNIVLAILGISFNENEAHNLIQQGLGASTPSQAYALPEEEYGMMFKFLIWGPVAEATDAEGVCLSGTALAAIDFVVISIADPVIHIADGFGKEIL